MTVQPSGGRPAPATTDVPGGDVAAAIAQILRDGLAAGTDRDALDRMLATVADVLGHPAIAVGAVEGDHLRLLSAHGFPPDLLHENLRVAVDHGIVGAAVTGGQPVVCVDAGSDPHWEDYSHGRHRSGVAVPMHLADVVWGVVLVESPHVGAFGDADVARLVPLADEMAWALEAVRLRRETVRRAEREQALRRKVEAITTVIAEGLRADDPGDVLDRTVRAVRDRLGWDSLAVLLRHDDGTLSVDASYGYQPDVAGMTFSEERGIVGRVVRTGSPYLASDTRGDPFYDDVVAGTRCEMCAPLRVGGEFVGVLNAEATEPGRFTPDDLDLLVRLADLFGLVLHNVELLQSERRTVAQLQELDRLKDEFVAITSHELRTPLTSVVGFADVLERRRHELDDDQHRMIVEALARQARVLSRLVEDVLVAARIDRGQLSIAFAPVWVDAVLAEVVRGREDEIEIGPGVEHAVVHADSVRVQQILSNLIDNALKYAGASTVEVDALADGAVVAITVRDDGPGIPEEHRSRIFERFHQVGQHGVAGRRGVGLGLAISRELARLMGGDVTLESAPGRGATFTLKLPAESVRTVSPADASGTVGPR